MQELIYALSPLNQPIVLEKFKRTYKTEPVNKEDEERREMNRRYRRKKVILSVAAAMLAIILYFAVNLLGAYFNMKSHHFKTADVFLDNALFIGNMSNMREYIDAGCYYEDGNYDKAINAFNEILNIEDSQELSQEAHYKKAAILVSDNQFDEAIGIYQALGSYKDSEELDKQTRYRKASYLLIEERSFKEALEIFEYLKSEGFGNANDMILETYYQWGKDFIIKEDYIEAYKKFAEIKDYKDTSAIFGELEKIIYKLAVDDYHEKEYSKALAAFKVLDPYLKSKDFLTLIDIRMNSYRYSNDQIVWTKLVPLIGMKDAEDLILEKSDYAHTFLLEKMEGRLLLPEYKKANKY